MAQLGCELRRGDDGTMRARDKESSIVAPVRLPMANARLLLPFFLIYSCIVFSTLPFSSSFFREVFARLGPEGITSFLRAQLARTMTLFHMEACSLTEAGE